MGIIFSAFVIISIGIYLIGGALGFSQSNFTISSPQGDCEDIMVLKGFAKKADVIIENSSTINFLFDTDYNKIGTLYYGQDNNAGYLYFEGNDTLRRYVEEQRNSGSFSFIPYMYQLSEDGIPAESRQEFELAKTGEGSYQYCAISPTLLYTEPDRYFIALPKTQNSAALQSRGEGYFVGGTKKVLESIHEGQDLIIKTRTED